MPAKLHHHHHDSAWCPLVRSSKLIGDVWNIMIVSQLLAGAKRFCQLEDAINAEDELGNISTRTLSQRLKLLEASGIIKRTVFKETPPHSEYSLTEKGSALSGIIQDLRSYGMKYLQS
jgi:DNA-binding HxlR family transcriptional regulator